ncbi:3-oxo-tetronate kinase [Pseudonocardia sp. CA-107938]|uniref:3-oxo-tetronate kinase n=1 Tax=Pseudonocardia sp. CA-107938 TaxID=3240021 RepID=UPI003D8A6FA5
MDRVVVVLGIIADDLTGATDAASAVLRTGLRVALTFGTPSRQALLDVGDVDVVVAALKIRNVCPAEAVAAARATLAAFADADVVPVYYKYCSTFDSTPAGNIGPVADAFLAALGAEAFLHVPGYPDNGRTVYHGHLFVDGVPLHESSMRTHPLNPMTDANLTRVLRPQTSAAIGQLRFTELRHAAGPELRRSTAEHVIADTLDNDDIAVLAELVGEHAIAGGGAPMAAAVCARLARGTGSADLVRDTPPPAGREVVIAGSASAATARQIAAFPGPALRLSATDLADAGVGERVLDWATSRWADHPVLIASDADHTPSAALPDGRSAAEAVEQGLGRIAAALVAAGARRIVVAGGETSGAVATALGLSGVRIGAEIATGVPWTFTPDGDLAVAFKSGNFGPDDLFSRAFALLREPGHD